MSRARTLHPLWVGQAGGEGGEVGKAEESDQRKVVAVAVDLNVEDREEEATSLKVTWYINYVNIRGKVSRELHVERKEGSGNE